MILIKAPKKLSLCCMAIAPPALGRDPAGFDAVQRRDLVRRPSRRQPVPSRGRRAGGRDRRPRRGDGAAGVERRGVEHGRRRDPARVRGRRRHPGRPRGAGRAGPPGRAAQGRASRRRTAPGEAQEALTPGL